MASPLSCSFGRRWSWFDGGLSTDRERGAAGDTASRRGGDTGRSEDDVAGGEGIVSMSCLELAPLRNGFLEGRDRLSGDGGRSMPFDPLFWRPRTVPSRLSPPKPLFDGGGPAALLATIHKNRTNITYLSQPGMIVWKMDLAHRLSCSLECEQVL